jgi:hypothetical protein
MGTMSDQSPTERHPVITGLIALVSVGLVVGLIAGLAALVGTHVLGLGAAEASGGEGAGKATLYLPKPEKTQAPSAPLITLAPGETPTGGSSQPSEPSDSPTKQENRISLSAGENSVAPMQQIDLTGIYPGGEGAILRVQRFESGQWQDFPVTASVSNQTFSTYVQTSRSGVNKFRVVDTDSGLKSNPVRVTVG